MSPHCNHFGYQRYKCLHEYIHKIAAKLDSGIGIENIGIGIENIGFLLTGI